MQQLNYKRIVIIVILISTFLRIYLGNSLEFGNDEVYYWLYAKYPDISHFDHPPMVGLFIQFFTLDLFFDTEVTIRLAAIIPISLSMYVLFLIGKYLKDEKVGLVSVLLYNIHIYGFVIAGTFILPDAPLVFFWLLSFYFFIQVLPKEPDRKLYPKLLLAFLFSGLAIYSKYQAIYLVFGVSLFIVVKNKQWLKKSVFYLGFIFPILAISMIFYWNYLNDFISYKFHGGRVSFFGFRFNKISFLREILGQFVYNNPYIIVVFVLMLIALKKKRFQLTSKTTFIFLSCSLPLILTTIYLSISRNTLPHWSGISYLTLLPLLAVFLSEKKRIIKKLTIGMLSFFILLIFVSVMINTGFLLPENTSKTKERLGRKDAILDMYGWEQASEKISEIFLKHNLTDLPIITNRWYPAAHIDYYIARPNKMKVYGVGTLKDIHKYYWINKQYPALENRVLYITDSRNFKNPYKLYSKEYSKIEMLETVPIIRGNHIVKYIFLYELTKD
ncbi:glycosyltransferase family 39 protein [uncultured Tenacibaculum sp.]|uniref:ArnT family glycosyltransferase n=1 Tax=uncultured Tenacibaculum sp. TaxID=174713 RepID=UPI00260694B1|nr:glycosyltransferase family 39 protein [uncultured Tenacibaculum sp.]